MSTNGTAMPGVSAPGTALVLAPAPNAEALSQVQDNTLELALNREPGVVLAEAQKAALALKEVISHKPNPVFFNGDQYLEFEDWQTVGRFYGITARVQPDSARYVEFGEVHGFEATAEAYHSATGQVLSTATSMCLSDEPRWAKKPLFQVRSMAQTRACSKVMRNVLSWVVVLAGYRPTPAEEMEGVPGFAGIDTGGAPQGTKQAAQNVASRKIAEMKKKAPANANPDPSPKPWKTHGEFLALCELLRERVGETRWDEELDLAGVNSPRDFINNQDLRGALAFHRRLTLIAEQESIQ
jgi:hypothetical protein